MSATTLLAEAVNGAGVAPRPENHPRLADMVLDVLGCTLAGVGERAPRACRDGAVAAPGDATVFGTGTGLAPADAALANGAAAHALDFDDVQQPWFGHPSAVLVPAVWAAADVESARGRPVTGADVLEAVHTGLVVGDGIGALLNTAHYDAGWHPTGTIGTLAAAAATAHLWGLDVRQTADALGLAAASSGGLRVSFGSDAKPLQAGLAARAGLTAAGLARAGARSAAETIEGAHGFAATHGAAGAITSTLLADALEVARDQALARISFKRYPSCSATNAALDGVLELRAECGGRTVRTIACEIDPLAVRLLVHHRPEVPAQAKFSLEYCLAAAWVRGHLDLTDFTPEAVADPRVRDLMDRIAVRPAGPMVSTGDFPAHLTVTFDDGTTATRHVLRAQGRPELPLGRAALQDKFAANVAHHPAWLAAGDMILSLPDCDDLRVVSDILRRQAPATTKESVR
ncbi:MmgE/PrpD family protein [Cellulomonas dongxiuzhuiae]|uniref:MmgE/PrpD family protein n=1 Tax=Cellulomonas dongxiuzhuiae TaxID=2819979 RepID=A0ABX8GFM2_9CELL|nr:MmgE/PrpD family protein [Cellulomonas dongxiuzhuiae]MBO3093506.1 MmgE/PrpD family protein [Cellulomonas dongxiuzhuiae]QWC14638.1 MmgE/PrpD family protein [Cellulomonas dongxiuzhuiae]